MNKSLPLIPSFLPEITALFLSITLLGASSFQAAHSSPDMENNLRPVIGVFSQETSTLTGSSTIDPEVKAKLEAYRYLIPVSYVTWIGQAGGRVLPILLKQPKAYYEEIFAQTNGILFPGGNQGIDPDDIYTEEGEVLWNLVHQLYLTGE